MIKYKEGTVLMTTKILFVLEYVSEESSALLLLKHFEDQRDSVLVAVLRIYPLKCKKPNLPSVQNSVLWERVRIF